MCSCGAVANWCRGVTVREAAHDALFHVALLVIDFKASIGEFAQLCLLRGEQAAVCVQDLLETLDKNFAGLDAFGHCAFGIGEGFEEPIEARRMDGRGGCDGVRVGELCVIQIGRVEGGFGREDEFRDGLLGANERREFIGYR